MRPRPRHPRSRDRTRPTRPGGLTVPSPPSLPSCCWSRNVRGRQVDVLDALEDMALCGDNLPPPARPVVTASARPASRCPSRWAWTCEAAASTKACPLFRSIEGVTPELLYSFALGRAIRRYDETRRRHPWHPIGPPRTALPASAAPPPASADVRHRAHTTTSSPRRASRPASRRYAARSTNPLSPSPRSDLRSGSHAPRTSGSTCLRRQSALDRSLRPLTGKTRRPGFRLADPSGPPRGRCRGPVNPPDSRYWAPAKLFDRGIRLHGGRHRSSGDGRNGEAVARRGFFADCPASRPRFSASDTIEGTPANYCARRRRT